MESPEYSGMSCAGEGEGLHLPRAGPLSESSETL